MYQVQRKAFIETEETVTATHTPPFTLTPHSQSLKLEARGCLHSSLSQRPSGVTRWRERVLKSETTNHPSWRVATPAGLILAMGIFQCKVFSDYWRTFNRLYTAAFAQVMPRDRFMIIWRYLHLGNNYAPQGENPDKLAKLRPMITHLNHVFKRTLHRTVTFQVYTGREAGQEQSLAHRVVKFL
ncbi:hypothetical protein RRG08_049941 [Elysia crispata]|uniref:PiggyBac transposable element-derived protein domain-containing protein n=1 Tax=Elysia crispata TaxID=231223 RepID=A0AAE1E3N5_9GAST|nr:hypothetical protein RRG08_049941 [Elysia crispata]